ncbi:hypothetical protein [Haloarcula ordinaria]|nr:hypothetical protein [Halomicroarcula sp. ZS-22-S1]
MPRDDRRSFLFKAGVGLSVSLAGCSSLNPTASEGKPSTIETTSEGEENESLRAISDLERIKETQKLEPSDVREDDMFGQSNAISNDGDEIVVGTGRGTVGGVPKTGYAEIYNREEKAWSNDQKITLPNPKREDGLGDDLEISDDGSTIAITAPGRTPKNASKEGAVYIYRKSNQSWERETVFQTYSYSIALSGSGDTLVLEGALDREEERIESLYVFQRTDSGDWSQEATLEPSRESGGQYISKVEISGDGSTIAVRERSSYRKGGKWYDTGYIFRKSEGTWSQEAYIDGNPRMFGGGDIAITHSGDKVLVGGEMMIDDSNNIGAVYVFTQDRSWSQREVVPGPKPEHSYNFGYSIDVSSDGAVALVCNPFEEIEKGGGAYILHEDNRSYEYTRKLAPAGGDPADRMSDGSVAGNGRYAVVGSRDEHTSGVEKSGAAYVFEL